MSEPTLGTAILALLESYDNWMGGDEDAFDSVAKDMETLRRTAAKAIDRSESIQTAQGDDL